MKRDPMDAMFSDIIRARDDYTCQYCGKVQNRETKRPQMDCAHFKGRRYSHVRWDELNACCLCHGCHMYMHDNPDEWTEFYTKRLGSKKVEELGIRAHTLWPKVDKKAIKESLKKRIGELER